MVDFGNFPTPFPKLKNSRNLWDPLMLTASSCSLLTHIPLLAAAGIRKLGAGYCCWWCMVDGTVVESGSRRAPLWPCGSKHRMVLVRVN